jgi:hypothetical protein
MTLAASTFELVTPKQNDQVPRMAMAREAFAELAAKLNGLLPEGPDKTHVLRVVRDAAMWANVAITRQPDGSPR